MTMNRYQVVYLKHCYSINKSLSNSLFRVYSKGANLNNKSEFFGAIKECLDFDDISCGKITPLNK